MALLFRGLTHGCQRAPLRVPTDPRLLHALAIDLIVAWRIPNSTRAGRAYPAGSSEGVCEPQAGYTLDTLQHHGHPPPTPPPLRPLVRSLAPLGGCFARQGDGEPGIKAIWQGYLRLHECIEAIDTVRTVNVLERNV
jgi:hypothetical protein